MTTPTHLQRLILLGFMGAGKSTIGRLLASRLHWDFLDLDAHIETRNQATIPQLFTQGESHFRSLESAALADALTRSNTILALGGGTPEDPSNRRLIEQTPGAFTIFLSAPFEVLYDRCILQQIDRPILADLDLARDRFDRRQPLYTHLANLTLDTTHLTSLQSVEAILSNLPQLNTNN